MAEATQESAQRDESASESHADEPAPAAQHTGSAPDLSTVDPATVDAASIDATAVDPVDFANMVRTASDEQLAAGIAAARELILSEIFRRMAEHFDPEAAPDVDAVIVWRITGREDGGYDQYQVVIRGGTCEVQREVTETPRAILEVPAVSFVRVVTGNLFGAAVYLSGKLKVEGDVSFAMQVQSFFRIPEPTAAG